MWWALLLAFGVGAGLCLVAYLVVDPPWYHAFALLGVVFTGGVGIAVAAATEAYARPTTVVVAVIASIASLVGGYWLGSALLPTLVERAAPEPLTARSGADHRIAIVGVACIEPERYSLRPTLLDVAALQRAADARVPDAALPFLLTSERLRYRSAGGSGGRPMARQLLELMAAHLPGDRFAAPIAAWCSGGPLPAQAVADAVAAGARTVVLLPLAVAPSVPIQQALERVDDLKPSDAGIAIVTTPYLDDLAPLDEHIAGLLAQRVSPDERAAVGVALVGCGQPSEWDRAYPEGPEQETAFMQRVRIALAEREFLTERVRLAWAEWRQPDVTEVVRHLAALGCARVLVVPACAPFPTLASALDVAQAVRLARVEDVPEVEVLPSWGGDPVVAEMLAAAVLRAVEQER